MSSDDVGLNYPSALRHRAALDRKALVVSLTGSKPSRASYELGQVEFWASILL